MIPALHAMNSRYGFNTVYLGSIHDARKEASTRIPFCPALPREESDETADNDRHLPTRYPFTPEQLARRRGRMG